jgi:hypothetical protein
MCTILWTAPNFLEKKIVRYYIESKGEWDDVGMCYISKVIRYRIIINIYCGEKNNWIKIINRRDH